MKRNTTDLSLTLFLQEMSETMLFTQSQTLFCLFCCRIEKAKLEATTVNYRTHLCLQWS